MLPAIVRHARIAFRDYDREQREYLVEETIANCLVAFVRLVELGKAGKRNGSAKGYGAGRVR